MDGHCDSFSKNTPDAFSRWSLKKVLCVVSVFRLSEQNLLSKWWEISVFFFFSIIYTPFGYVFNVKQLLFLIVVDTVFNTACTIQATTLFCILSPFDIYLCWFFWRYLFENVSLLNYANVFWHFGIEKKIILKIFQKMEKHLFYIPRVREIYVILCHYWHLWKLNFVNVLVTRKLTKFKIFNDRAELSKNVGSVSREFLRQFG